MSRADLPVSVGMGAVVSCTFPAAGGWRACGGLGRPSMVVASGVLGSVALIPCLIHVLPARAATAGGVRGGGGAHGVHDFFFSGGESDRHGEESAAAGEGGGRAPDCDP